MNFDKIMVKERKEWTIKAAWGKLAMISWGSSAAPPVLMVHGYMDTAATFYLLAEYLSDEFYYVAFDLPGHGKSDPLPPGPLANHGHMVETVRTIVDHLEWKSFLYMGHSMGVYIGYIYNAIYPGRINSMVCLDPGPSLSPFYEANCDPHVWFKRYQVYYDNHYGKSSSNNPKLYQHEEIVSTLRKNRHLTSEQAEVVLSRSLVEVGDGLYRLTWEPRVKSISTLAISADTLSHISCVNVLPILVTVSTMDDSSEKEKKFAKKIMNAFSRLKNYSIVFVDGHHDVHITSPEKMAAIVNDFLKVSCVKSKL